MFSNTVSSEVSIFKSFNICIREILDLTELLFQSNNNSCLFIRFRFFGITLGAVLMIFHNHFFHNGGLFEMLRHLGVI